MSSIYDEVEQDLETYTNRYIMSTELWSKFDIRDLTQVDFSLWKSIKLISDPSGKFSENLVEVPNNYGGIYIYSIHPGIIPNCGSYVMYIGMASKTDHENLRTRIKQYQKETGASYTRERLHRLFRKWGDYVYLHYLPVDASREEIAELEDRLIASLTPPCNAEIRVKSVKTAVKAFN